MNGKTTWISLPRHVLVGDGALDELLAVLEEVPVGGHPLIVTSETPRKVAGDMLESLCSNAGLNPDIVEIDSASFEAVTRVRSEIDEHDVLIGVGGGKVIDVTKLASVEESLAYVSVPTAASHDGIVSSRGSIPDDGERHSVQAKPPEAVIADTRVIADAPWELTTAGYADIVSNYTAVLDWRLANRLHGVEYSHYSAALSEMTAEMLVGQADSIRPGLTDSAWLIVKALVSSGVAMSIAGSSRPASGAEHLFSHQLDRLCDDPALHGHQVGVGSIVTMYLHGGDWKLIRDALERVDAPTTAADLGVASETVVDALVSAPEIRDRYTILGDGIDRMAAREALEAVGVI